MFDYSEGQRVFIVGSSGSGKSTHARVLTLKTPLHWLIIDPKNDVENIANWYVKHKKRVGTTEHASEIIKITKYPYLIYTPLSHIDDDEIDRILLDIHNRVNHVGILIDETYLLKNGKGIKSLLTRGRSKGQTIISCSQRPTVTPPVIRSEASKIIIHRLTSPEDAVTMSKFSGFDLSEIKALKKYDFLETTE